MVIDIGICKMPLNSSDLRSKVKVTEVTNITHVPLVFHILTTSEYLSVFPKTPCGQAMVPMIIKLTNRQISIENALHSSCILLLTHIAVPHCCAHKDQIRIFPFYWNNITNLTCVRSDNLHPLLRYRHLSIGMWLLHNLVLTWYPM